MRYDFKTTEQKWQEAWEEAGIFHASDDYTKPTVAPCRNCGRSSAPDFAKDY